MNTLKLTFCASIAGLSMSACASNRISTAERDAAVTAAATSSANAAIVASNDNRQIDGSVGAAEGYFTGCRTQGGCFVDGKLAANRDELAFDREAGRYYFVDPLTRRTYWDNGQARG